MVFRCKCVEGEVYGERGVEVERDAGASQG